MCSAYCNIMCRDAKQISYAWGTLRSSFLYVVSDPNVLYHIRSRPWLPHKFWSFPAPQTPPQCENDILHLYHLANGWKHFPPWQSEVLSLCGPGILAGLTIFSCVTNLGQDIDFSDLGCEWLCRKISNSAAQFSEATLRSWDTSLLLLRREKSLECMSLESSEPY